jgi:hypothetical protein
MMRWQAYVMADDVVMLPYDDLVTAVDLGASSAIQVAQGNTMSDASAVATTCSCLSRAHRRQ